MNHKEIEVWVLLNKYGNYMNNFDSEEDANKIARSGDCIVSGLLVFKSPFK